MPTLGTSKLAAGDAAVDRTYLGETLVWQQATAARTADTFDTGPLNTTRWVLTPPSVGTGGGVTFDTPGFATFTTSTRGSYSGQGAVWLTENITPTADNSNTQVQARLLPVGDGQFALVSRVTDPGDEGSFYMLQLNPGLARAYLSWQVGAAYGQLAEIEVPGGSPWSAKLITETLPLGGHRLRAKVWTGSSPEPATWLIDVHDNAHPELAVGTSGAFASPGSVAQTYSWPVDSLSVTAVPTSPNPKLHTLGEDWTALNTWKWPNRSANRHAIVNGAMEVTTAGASGEYNLVSTAQMWDATDSHVHARVVTATPNISHGTYLAIERDSNNTAYVFREGNTIGGRVINGGAGTDTPIGTYNATTHAWWRVREASGQFIFGTSPDGLTWTETAGVAHTWDPSEVYTYLMVGRWQGTDPAGTGSFDKVNLPPTQGPVDPDPGTPATIVWREEFTSPLSMTTVAGGPGRWRSRGADDQRPTSEGYTDYVAKSWNISPEQHPAYNPFTVANSILTITAKRNPGIPGVSNPWVGGHLCTEPLTTSFDYGYYEIRARIPVAGRGMFPAIWMYNNRIGENAEVRDKAAAEFDILEIFGHPTGQPWTTSVRQLPIPGTTTVMSDSSTDTAGWHRYGLSWTADDVSLYRDGIYIASLAPSEAEWFRGVDMSIRLNVAVDPAFEGAPQSTISDPAPGTEFRLEVDYVRRYDKKPAVLATGTDDPEPA